jgi:hypothetical protein
MRLRTFRIRTLLLIIAFLALILTVIAQSVALQRAAAREQQMRAETARKDQALAALSKALVEAEQLQTFVTEELKQVTAEADDLRPRAKIERKSAQVRK